MQLSIWTPPAAETFQCLLHVLYSAMAEIIQFSSNGICFAVLFQF